MCMLIVVMYAAIQVVYYSLIILAGNGCGMLILTPFQSKIIQKNKGQAMVQNKIFCGTTDVCFYTAIAFIVST